MTDRQTTGLWFIVTGILLLSLWLFAFAIVNLSIDVGFAAVNSSSFSDEQQYLLGAAGVVALQFVSLTGIPVIITGVAQMISGAPKAKKKHSAKK